MPPFFPCSDVRGRAAGVLPMLRAWSSAGPSRRKAIGRAFQRPRVFSGRRFYALSALAQLSLRADPGSPAAGEARRASVRAGPGRSAASRRCLRTGCVAVTAAALRAAIAPPGATLPQGASFTLGRTIVLAGRLLRPRQDDRHLRVQNGIPPRLNAGTVGAGLCTAILRRGSAAGFGVRTGVAAALPASNFAQASRQRGPAGRNRAAGSDAPTGGAGSCWAGPW